MQAMSRVQVSFLFGFFFYFRCPLADWTG